MYFDSFLTYGPCLGSDLSGLFVQSAAAGPLEASALMLRVTCPARRVVLRVAALLGSACLWGFLR